MARTWGKLAKIEASVDPQMLERWQAVKPLIVEVGEIGFHQARQLWELTRSQTTTVIREMREAGLPLPYPTGSAAPAHFGTCPQCAPRNRKLQVWVDERDQLWRFCLYCGYEVIE